MHSRDSINKLLTIALVISSSVALLEFIGWLLSNSVALLSDTIHVLTDVTALLLTLMASKVALKSHTPKLTYGYHRAEVLAALANGILLIILVFTVSFEAYDRFIEQEKIDSVILIWIAIIGLIANFITFVILKDIKNIISVRSALMHIFSDTLSSLSITIGGFMIYYTNILIIDPLISIGISLLILRHAIILIKDTIHILLEGVPEGISIEIITRTIKDIKGVIDIHDLHVWCITTDLLALSAHIVIEDQMVSESIKIIDEIKRRMNGFGIRHTTIQLESERNIDINKSDK
ncbi:MAG: cation diffusion facilitator family transporter [Candidatus Nitrosocaldaceae archaeon]